MAFGLPSASLDDALTTSDDSCRCGTDGRRGGTVGGLEGVAGVVGLPPPSTTWVRWKRRGAPPRGGGGRFESRGGVEGSMSD